jgi:serine/threonine protein kinase
LFGLLSLDHQELGYEDVEVPDWTLKDILGHGRFATVYKAQHEHMEHDVVLKMFKIDDDSVRESEVSTLTSLRAMGVRNIPVVEELCPSATDEKCFLAVSPIGSPILPVMGGDHTNGTHWATLVRVLQAAHRAGIAHRDVKPDNIFLHGDSIVLNDWGSSCVIGQSIRFAGTPAYCVDRPGEDGCHVPTASSDLLALVRSVYSMLTLRVPPEEGHDDIASFWRRSFRDGTVWHEAIASAVNADYDALCDALAKML